MTDAKLVFARRISRTISIPLLILAICLLGCAEIAPPPGGEEDRIGPILIESVPLNGATGVAAGKTVEIVFSERIIPPRAGSGVFISPRPTGEVKVDWQKDRVTVELDEEFSPDQTYVVSISKEVTDLRRNKIDSAVSVAFTRGDHLDSGLVEGQVLTLEGKPIGGWLVGLWRHLEPEDLLAIDSIYPDYLASAGQDGRFRFQNLPEDYYLLVAFEDKSRDELLNVEAEQFALPDRKITVTDSAAGRDFLLTALSHDTLPSGIASAIISAGDLVKIRLKNTINPAIWLDKPHLIHIARAGQDSVAVSACGALESDLPQTNVLTAHFGRLDEGMYTLRAEGRPDEEPLTFDSVDIKPVSDQERPEILRFVPSSGRYFVNQVDMVVTFDEPIDTSRLTAASFMLVEDSAKTLALNRTWRDCFRLGLEAPDMAPGKQYRLEVSDFDIWDASGNQLGDSVQSFRFATYSEDSLGSISGKVRVSVPERPESLDAPVRLTFKETVSGKDFPLQVREAATIGEDGFAEHPFMLEVPAGKYLVSGFVDENRSGAFTPGSARPYRLGEMRMISKDTIIVRARFETAGIELKFE